MRILSPKKPIATVGLDIEAGSIAATEVRVNGEDRVAGAAIGPLEPGVFSDGEVVERDALSDALRSLWAEHKLSRNVRLGLANQRLVVRILRLPAIEDPKELESAVRFKAQDEIPMPLEKAVLDHQVVGGVPAEEGSAAQIDVVVVAARRDMVSSFVDAVRRAGLNPAGVDLSAFGMIRALAGNGAADPAAVLYCYIGDVTNLAVARGRACLFTRVSGVGLGGPAGKLAASRDLSLDHARQWLGHVGLAEPIEAIEGDAEVVVEARRALEHGASALLDELRMSLDYYKAQEGVPAVERVVVCGPGSALRGLPEHMEKALGIPFAAGRPQALTGFDESAAARLTLSYGLALGE
jgi:type IV pilus assembly protein PilM